MAKILIIKLGYSETIDAGVSKVPSLGDVLRTTVILHAFKGDDVTWLVDGNARPLLEGNPYINRIIDYGCSAGHQLQREYYDMVINLEKDSAICALAESISAGTRSGFRFDERRGAPEPYVGCEWLLNLCLDRDLKRSHRLSWQESLLKIVGATWEGQEYILGYRPGNEEQYDVGLNWAVGSKWPNKKWPDSHWQRLEALLGGKYTCSMQQGMDNLYRYMDWINSCRVLVTSDSLGLHIALALGKKVVVLYGPTNPNETWFYGRGVLLFPDAGYDCIPCLGPVCRQEECCMAFIAPEDVRERVAGLLEGSL